VVPFPEQRLEDDLAILLASGLIVAQGDASPRAYAFKHALIQEAAYSSLLKRTRQGYHGRIAQTLADRIPRGAQLHPEILAEHFSRAGLSAQAVDHWIQAGERSVAQGATLEARTFFDRALADLDPADHERHWRVLLAREAVLDLREERVAQREDVEALLNLAEALDDDLRREQALLRQASYGNRMEDYQLMLQASEAAITVAARIGNVAFEMEAMARKVVALARLAQWDAARQPVGEILVKMPEVADDVVQGYMFSALSMYYADLGDVSRALLFQHRYAEAARRAGDRKGESVCLWNIGLYLAQLGRYADARASYEAGLPIAEAIGDRHWQTSHKVGLSYALWCGGDHDGALEVGEAALRELRTSGYRRIGLADCLAYLGLILQDAQDYSTAAAYLAESRALYVEGGQHGSGMEVQAIEARCRAELGQEEEAWRLAAEVWAFVRGNGTASIDFPSRIYLCIADVVAQVAMPGVTEREVLDAGYANLVQKADLISDPEWRRSFLEDELSNRALAIRWKSLNRAEPG